MKKRIRKWWQTLKPKCRYRKYKQLKCFCKKIDQQTNILKDIINQEPENIQKCANQNTEILGAIDQKTKELINQTNTIIEKVGEHQNNISTESNKSMILFDELLNNAHHHNNHNEKLPECINFSSSFKKEYRPPTYTKSIIKDPGEKSNNICWMIVGIVLLLAFFAAFLFVPIKCAAQPNDSLVTINSLKTNIPIKESLNGYNHIYARSIVIDSTYHLSRDTGNNVQKESMVPTHDKATVHGEIHYDDTSWHSLLYCLLIAIIASTAAVFSIKFIMPLWTKEIDFKQKYRERRYNDYIRLSDEDREYESLQFRTELAIYEKREKARIDEWQRNNEHQRKLDIMEQERIANLSNVLVELAKTKNTVTLKDARNIGKTITIERSILSDDCCSDIKDVIKDYSAHSDDCCDKIKE